MVDGAGVYVFSYDGRLVCSPKHQGLKADLLNMQTITLSNDTVAIRDKIDEKGWLSLFLSISLFCPLPPPPPPPYTHTHSLSHWLSTSV